MTTHPLFYPVLLQAIGVLLILAEVIIPSGGLITFFTMGIFVYSLYLVFTGVSAAAGAVFVIFDIILIPVMVIVAFRLLARSPVTLKTRLSGKQGYVSQSDEEDVYLNQSGKTLTNLRPSGMAIIGGKRVDVVSRGEYIEKDTEITVIAVTGNQVIVRKA